MAFFAKCKPFDFWKGLSNIGHRNAQRQKNINNWSNMANLEWVRADLDMKQHKYPWDIIPSS